MLLSFLTVFAFANTNEQNEKEKIKKDLKECFSLNSSSSGHPDLEKVNQCMEKKKIDEDIKKYKPHTSEITTLFKPFI